MRVIFTLQEAINGKMRADQGGRLPTKLKNTPSSRPAFGLLTRTAESIDEGALARILSFHTAWMDRAEAT